VVFKVIPVVNSGFYLFLDDGFLPYWFVVETFCARNTPDTIGFDRGLGGSTTTMKRRFVFALNIGQFNQIVTCSN
jgi:hypothetical protein